MYPLESHCLSFCILLQPTQKLYMLDYVGPAGFATAAAEEGAKSLSHLRAVSCALRVNLHCGPMADGPCHVFRVILLDHHKTALEMFEAPGSQHPNLELHLDMSRSGATIALDYFKPNVRQVQCPGDVGQTRIMERKLDSMT